MRLTKTLKPLFLAVVFTFVAGIAQAQHQIVLVDFGNNSSFRGTNVTNPDINGRYWNSVWSGVFYANMPDYSNNPTTISLGFDSVVGTDYFNGPSGATQNPSACVIDAVALGNLGVNEAVYDYYVNSKFQIQGLDPARNYQLKFFGSHKFNTDNITRYGIYTDTNYSTLVASVDLTVGIGSAHNSNTVATLSGLSPQTDNKLFVKFAGINGNSGYLNCMQILSNYRPTTTNLNLSRRPGSAVTIPKANLAADADSDTLTFTLSTTTNGVTLTQDSTNVYVPASAVADRFTFTVYDNFGGTNSATVTLSTRTNLIEVYGSSVAKGFNGGGSLTNGSYANGYAGLMTSFLGSTGWVVTNLSTAGDTTSNGLVRFPTNVVMVDPNYIMLAFGLNNEGLAGSSDPAGIVTRFTTNLTNLITQCRSNGFYPVVNCSYPSTNYSASEYTYLKSVNLTINSWSVPSVNLLGTLDNGSGSYVTGYNVDSIHPNAAGHQEMFYAIVPSLFDAIAQGKTNSPTLAVTNYARLTQAAGVTAPFSFTPSNTMRSFTMSFRVRSTSNGTIAAIKAGAGYATLQITNGQFIYTSTNGSQIIASGVNATNGGWFSIALAHRYALTNTWLMVDGAVVGTLSEQFVPEQFVLGGPAASGAPATPSVADFQNWCVYRSAWNAGEAAAQMQGNLQQASMEIGAMLADATFTSNSPALNRAQSLSVAMVNTANLTAGQSLSAPGNLTATPLASPQIGASLTWSDNSTGESGFLIQRRLTSASTWNDLATLAANTTGYTDSGLTSGTSYDYRVIVLEGGLRGNASASASVTTGFGTHQVILVDLGPNDGTNGDITINPDWQGQYWNNLVGTGGGGGLGALGLANMITTTGNATTVGLRTSATGWAANGKLNGGLLTPSRALLGNFAVTNATADYFLTTTSASLTLTNLNPVMQYRLRLFGTRDTTISRTTRFVATGSNGSFTNDLVTSGTGIGSGGANGNNNTIASINSITPDGNNQIQLTVSTNGGGFAYLGIVELLANSQPTARAITNGTPAGVTSISRIIGGKASIAPTDADGDALLVAQVQNPSALLNATVTTDGTNIFYTPGLNASGADTVQYVVSDGYGGFSTNTMYVTVTGQSFNLISGPTLLNNQFQATFAGIPNQTYTVDDSTNSAAGPWAYYTTLTAGTNGLFQLIATNNPPAAQRFFRTRAQLP